jgi:broad specificity phosphatase PhoE
MRLLLVRHGQTLSNVNHLLDTGHPGPVLTELGEQQAAALVEALSSEDIKAIFASTLRRTQQTAQPLADDRGLPVQVRDGIREIDAGELELRSDQEAVDLYVRTVIGWADGKLDARLPGGPSGASMLAAYDEVVSEIESLVEDDQTALLVSHGAAIRTWVAARVAGLGAAFAAANALANTAVVILQGSMATGWSLVSWDGRAVTGEQPAAADAAATELPG